MRVLSFVEDVKHKCSFENIFLCLSALEAVLSDMGAPINKGAALEAATAAMK